MRSVKTTVTALAPAAEVAPDTSSGDPPEQGAGFALRMLLPYLWRYRWRLLMILLLLSASKVALLGVPLAFKHIVDALDPKQLALVVPMAALAAYGGLRIAASILGEARGLLFAAISTRARREIALVVFQHLHRLSLRFHLERRTGGLSRAIEKGTRAIEDFLYYVAVSIFPTLLEVSLALAWLLYSYPPRFALVTLATLVIYVFLTIKITNWRTTFYRAANKADQESNARAVDSLLNFETVKYFGNERFEADRFDEVLTKHEVAARKSWTTLTALNLAQSLTISIGLLVLMALAAQSVAKGTMTLGDLVLVNTLLLQLYAPLQMLGMMYRNVRQSLTDMERMFALLEVQSEVVDAPNAPALQVSGGAVRLRDVHFAYDLRRPILKGLDLDLPAGSNIAVVGTSGAGKSTIARLLYRFYDAQSGQIEIDGQDIRSVQQDSVRRAIAIVPQDTVLFNDTIYYNIAYGNPLAERSAVIAAAQTARIHDFICAQPDGYDTQVGERGLKLSGGEKQRVAIARAVLKNPAILIFDEATSALDSHTELAILQQLAEVARGRTTLTIAHRLSTVVNANRIIVLSDGAVVEQGTHADLLAKNGVYASLWRVQQREQQDAGPSSNLLALA